MTVSVHRAPNGDSLKTPARAHKGGTHTWDHYDAHRQRVLAPGQPVGILMRDLICVGINDATLVPVWEAKNPCLFSSARETTRKGTHYIFRRPPSATLSPSTTAQSSSRTRLATNFLWTSAQSHALHAT